MPTRYLKPGIRDSEIINDLSPMAEIMFYRLLVTVDDCGRYDGRPSMVKSACFPIKENFTSQDCEELLKELSQKGVVQVYLHNGKPFLQITRWDNAPRAASSKYPEYSDACEFLYTDACNCIQANTVAPLTVTKTKTQTVTETDILSGEKSPDQSAKNNAKEILEYLNEKSGRSFKLVASNIKLINSRLIDFTVEELKSVIDKKCDEWLDDPVMSAYVRPETLFNATKCAGYVATPSAGKRTSQAGYKTKQQIIRENNDKAWEEFLNDDSGVGDEKIIEGEVIRD